MLIAACALAAALASAVHLLDIVDDRTFRAVAIEAPGYTLHGRISEGRDPNGPWVVFLHGHRREGQAHVLYRTLTDNLTGDVSVLALDLRGFGRSELGEIGSGEPVLNRGADVEAALDYLNSVHGVGADRVILMGHSFGAAQVLAGLRHVEETRRSGVRHGILIGPADYDVFVQGDDRMREYISKVERNMGVVLTAEEMVAEGTALTAAVQFATCPATPLTIVTAGQDHGDTLGERPEKIPYACRQHIQWVTVPMSNHMYWTEDMTRRGYLRAKLSTGLLAAALDDLLAALSGEGET